MDLREWTIENALELYYEFAVILADFDVKGTTECRIRLMEKVREWDKKGKEQDGMRS